MSGTHGRSGEGGTGSRSVEVAPLTQRVAAMLGFRGAELVALAVLALVGGSLDVGVDGTIAALYAVCVLSLSAFVWVQRQAVGVRAFGLSLLVDGVFLQYAHERLGHGVAIDVALAAQLVAVCLLASFRTGLKLAVWQSVLMLVAWKSEVSGLVPKASALDGVVRDHAIVTDMTMLWLVVMTTSVAASINERELRRRRYDAEALMGLAAALLSDHQPKAVIERIVAFLVAELSGARVAVLNRSADGAVALVGGSGLADMPADASPDVRPDVWDGGASPSALVDMALGADGPVNALRLDPAQDRLLHAVMPQALRLTAVPLGSDGRTGVTTWMVLEFGRGGRNHRVERRTVQTASQAAATAAIALSRAQLIEAAQRAATTDGLTGVANRRTFDVTMAGLLADQQAGGVPFALALADVDKFKSVNDRYGHQIGDEVLQAVAKVFAAVAESGQGSGGEPYMAARYGGEEFALIMPGTATADAARMAETLRLALMEIQRPVPVTASFGVASLPQDTDSVAGLIMHADAALLRAKAEGRNRVVVHDPYTQAPAEMASMSPAGTAAAPPADAQPGYDALGEIPAQRTDDTDQALPRY